jgi:hypothetical protein
MAEAKNNKARKKKERVVLFEESLTAEEIEKTTEQQLRSLAALGGKVSESEVGEDGLDYPCSINGIFAGLGGGGLGYVFGFGAISPPPLQVTVVFLDTPKVVFLGAIACTL